MEQLRPVRTWQSCKKRLSEAQTEVGKYKKLSQTVEQRLSAKKIIEDAKSKFHASEAKVTNVLEMVDKLVDLTPEELGKKTEGASPIKKVEMAAAEAQASLKTVVRYLEVQSRSEGFAREEILKLQGQVDNFQQTLDGAVKKMREQSEKLLVGGLLGEAEEKLKEAEEAVKATGDAELPFLRGHEIPVEEASVAFDQLEKLSQEAHTKLGGAKTFLAMKRLAAKRLAETAAKLTNDGLNGFQNRLDEATQKLNDIKKGMAERRTETVRREAVA